MAAILQFRQGSKSSFISSGPYVSEPFFDTDTNIIHIGVSGSSTITLTKLEHINSGSFSISGDYEGTNINLSGDLTASNALLSGDITVGGNLILGDQVQDNITVTGQFDSNLIPSSSGEYDLGSTTKKWNNIFAVSGSIDSIDIVSNLPSGVISGSSQLPSGIISGSSQLPSGIISGSEQLPSSIVSSSQQVIDFLPTDTVSGSSQVINFLPSGVVSGSEQLPSGLVSGSSQITDGSNIFSSSIQVTANGIPDFQTESRRVNNIDGVISGSGQLPDGVVSGSSQVVDVLNEVNSFTSSQDTKNTTLATYTGSVDTSISSLNLFTSSFDTAISLNSNDVTILGNLTVQGTQTQLNTSTLNVEDLNILLASGSTTSAEADGAGITIDGADKSLQWEHSTTQFVFDAQVSSSVGFKGDGSNLTGLTADSVEYINILNKPTLISGSDQVTGISFSQIDGASIIDSTETWLGVDSRLTTPGAIDKRINNKGIVSGSEQISGITFSQIDPDSIILSTEPWPANDARLTTPGAIDKRFDTKGLFSGSEQVTIDMTNIDGGALLDSTESWLSVDSRITTPAAIDKRFDSKGLISGSSQLQSDYDNRYAASSSLHTLIGNFPTSGSLGTAAFYNVSSSLADDPSVIPNVKAVYDYINNTIGAADITGVSASLGLSGGGASGYVSLSLDTGSTHFQEGVELYSSTLPDGVISGSLQVDVTETTNYSSINQYSDTKVKNKLNSDGVISGSSQVTITESQISDLQSYLLRAPDGTVSGSSQTVDHIESSTLVAINQTSPSSLGTNGELIVNGTTNGYSGILTLESSSVKVYNQYATESDKMVNFLAGSGYGLYLQPDNTGTKAWVIDTDGDLVGQGTNDVYAENVYATGQFSGSQLFLASDGTIGTNLSVGGNLDVSGTIFGALSGSSQVDVTATTNYSSINQYTDTDNTDHLNSLGVVSGSSQVDVTATTNYANVVQTSGNQSIGGNKTFSNNVTISGDLNVAGTTTYTSTNNVNIGDNILELNFGGSATTGGILVKDATGTTTSGSLIWDSSTDNWKAGALGSESPIVRTTDLDYYTDSDNTSHLNSLGVISGSSQVNANTITNFDSNVKDKLNAETVISGSSQVSIGASQVTEISNLTADEGAQLENINSVTISNTQWGYLGAADQNITTTSNVIFANISGSNVHSEGTVTAEGDIVAYASSDERLKDKIIQISNPLDKINSIGGYSFVWNSEKQNIYSGKDYGVIAQEIEEILPELVTTRENGYKAVKYDKIISLLIEGIKELSTEVKELKEKINRE